MAKNFYAKCIKTFPIVATTSVIAISVGSSLIELLPNSILLNKYKKIVHLKKFEELLPLSKNIENLFNEVMDDLNIKEKNAYQPFACIGFDLIHAGISFFKYGSIIGIPVNYTYEDKSSVNASKIRVGYNQERLNIYHPATNDLIDSLILSNKAKKFGIARELLTINQNLSFYHCIDSPIMIVITVISADLLRINLNSSIKMTFSIKAGIFGITGLLGYSLWFQIRDSLNIYFEKSVDKQLANINPEYIEGGKEFYEKLLKKNIALRMLLGERGAKEFNKNGDEIFFIRHKRIPLTERLQFFNNYTFIENEVHVV